MSGYLKHSVLTFCALCVFRVMIFYLIYFFGGRSAIYRWFWIVFGIFSVILVSIFSIPVRIFYLSPMIMTLNQGESQG